MVKKRKKRKHYLGTSIDVRRIFLLCKVILKRHDSSPLNLFFLEDACLCDKVLVSLESLLNDLNYSTVECQN